MAKVRKDPVLSDEDDAPEAVSLSTSRKAVQQQDKAVKKAHAAQTEKKKAQNRERDRKLKQQSEKRKEKEKAVLENSKGKGKGKKREEDDDELMARMERAMKEAAEEFGEDNMSEDEFGLEDMEGLEDEEGFAFGSDDDFGEMDEDESGSDDGMDEDESEDSEEEFTGFGDPDAESMASEDEEPSLPPTKRKRNPDHLPDELFTAAFAAKSTSASEKKQANNDPTAKRRKMRKRSSAKAKDIVLGSRIIRTIETPTQPKAPKIDPQPKRNKKFLDRVLALKGFKSKTKTWERRPANVGVMRREGPAAHFVRNG